MKLISKKPVVALTTILASFFSYATLAQAPVSQYGLYFESTAVEDIETGNLRQIGQTLLGDSFNLPNLPGELPGDQRLWQDIRILRITADGNAELQNGKDAIEQDRALFEENLNKDLIKLLDTTDNTNGAYALARYLDYVDYGVFEEFPDSLKGISGASVGHFVRHLAERVHDAAPSGFGFVGRTQFLPGQIEEFQRDGEGNGAFYIRDVVQNTFNPTGTLIAQRFRNFAITISATDSSAGFSVFERGDDRLNPFPGNETSVEHLPGFITDGQDLRSIWARGLLYNLFVKGEAIQVDSIDERIESMVDGELKSSKRTWLPRVDRVYTTTNDSCIDLLMDRHQPSHISGFPEQRGYCLGSCDMQIINSY